MSETFALWHPFIVHFAVALSMVSALLDMTGLLFRSDRFDPSSFLLAVLAVPALLAAVLSGNLASSFIRDARQLAIVGTHETYANITVWVFCGAALWRSFLHLKKRFTGARRLLYVFLISLAAISVFLTARKGGTIRHTGYSAVVSRMAHPGAPHRTLPGKACGISLRSKRETHTLPVYSQYRA